MEWVLGQMIENKKIPAALYPLSPQTTGKISDPERERNASPSNTERRGSTSPARFAGKSPRRSFNTGRKSASSPTGFK